MRTDYDVIIVGSGPAGVHAAQEAVKSGLSVALIDVGFIDETYQNKIPDTSFSEIRRTARDQGYYFLGSDPARSFRDQERAGAHLTPPRQHMLERSEELFPYTSKNFYALLATSRGGLGTSWGSNTFSFNAEEFERIGFSHSEIAPFYSDVAREVGVSADATADTTLEIANFNPLLPPLQIDSNSENILASYRQRRERLLKRGFSLGQSPLASLSVDQGDRKANAYHDLDFWSDRRKTVYRPRYTLDKLIMNPKFTYLSRRVAHSFSVKDSVVSLSLKILNDEKETQLTCRRLILAAGALNTARIVAKSLGAYDRPFPILCNPNVWIAALNLKMLGKKARDIRHSLAQLTAVFAHDREQTKALIAQFYSYRSLMFFRLVKDLPFRHWISLKLLRYMMNAITLINFHFSDSPTLKQSMCLTRNKVGNDILDINFCPHDAQVTDNETQIKRFIRILLQLWVVPIKINRPLNGASIHYAGTVPITKDFDAFRTRPDGALWSAPEVYLADSSTWNFLPAKGLTFTVMAIARWVTQNAVKSLSANRS